MAVPKRRTSKSRRDRRRASNWKLTVPNLVECPQCHEKKQPHHACPACGYYDNRVVIDVEK
jgi:large subunit ribosomal protein L32